jgi:hypothetical protein
MREEASPTLNLQEVPGPVLKFDHASATETLARSGTPVAIGVTCTIALLAALVLVPLSRQSEGPTAIGATLASILPEFIQQILSDEAQQDARSESRGDASKPALMPEPSEVGKTQPPSASDPFEVQALAHLKGQRCFNYMPDGDNPKARQAFSELLWDKLEPGVRSLLEERLDVCSPFEAVDEVVIKAGGCRKSECGENDAHFYINTDGKVAIDYRIDGQCKQAKEEGFTQVQFLCAR